MEYVFFCCIQTACLKPCDCIKQKVKHRTNLKSSSQRTELIKIDSELNARSKTKCQKTNRYYVQLLSYAWLKDDLLRDVDQLYERVINIIQMLGQYIAQKEIILFCIDIDWVSNHAKYFIHAFAGLWNRFCDNNYITHSVSWQHSI